MAQLVRGTIADRPWGRTLAAIGLRGSTGQLTLVTDSKRYAVVFVGGAVVGAASPLASDAAVRVALTGGLLSSTQVADISRRQAAAPERDEIELIADALRLGPEQALRLRRRVVAQRAARTFSMERGDFVFDDQITVAVVPGSELDIRAVVFLGARQNLSEGRLESELAQLGSWFRLQPSAFEDCRSSVHEAERRVLELLRWLHHASRSAVIEPSTRRASSTRWSRSCARSAARAAGGRRLAPGIAARSTPAAAPPRSAPGGMRG